MATAAIRAGDQLQCDVSVSWISSPHAGNLARLSAVRSIRTARRRRALQFDGKIEPVPMMTTKWSQLQGRADFVFTTRKSNGPIAAELVGDAKDYLVENASGRWCSSRRKQ